tara:strand:+ start:404 stop:964 length:561 start_codon:yes stop_codon:yes gene_type:complete
VNEAKTITELAQINGALDDVNTYECVTSGGGHFSKGVVYQCKGMGIGIVDNDGVVLALGNKSTFKLVTPKEEGKTMRTPFNLERAIAGDKVVNKSGCEYNQFSVIKTRIKDVISCYSVEANDVYRYSEKDVNTMLFMAPKMGKGFVNVDVDGNVTNYRTKLFADKLANSDRAMCIDLSQFPEGYGL